MTSLSSMIPEDDIELYEREKRKTNQPKTGTDVKPVFDSGCDQKKNIVRVLGLVLGTDV